MSTRPEHDVKLLSRGRFSDILTFPNPGAPAGLDRHTAVPPGCPEQDVKRLTF